MNPNMTQKQSFCMQIPDEHWLVLTGLPGHFRNLYADCLKPAYELHHAVSWSPIKLVWIGRKLEQTNTLSSECNNLPTLSFFISAASSCLRNSSKSKANESMPTHACKNVPCFCLFFNFLLHNYMSNRISCLYLQQNQNGCQYCSVSKTPTYQPSPNGQPLRTFGDVLLRE